MNKKLVVLAALFWGGSCVQSVERGYLLAGEPQTGKTLIFDSHFDDLLAKHEEIRVTVAQQLEYTTFFLWLISLGKSVEKPFIIVDYTDGAMAVRFTKKCLFYLKYQDKATVNSLVISFQDPEQRAFFATYAEEAKATQQTILKMIADFEAEAQKMMGKNHL